MLSNGTRQLVYKPRVVMAHHPVGPNPHPASAICEYFTLPSGKGNSRLVIPAIEKYLLGLQFEYEWVSLFVLSADEAISNACEHGAPNSTVCGILTVVESKQMSFVSLIVDNACHVNPTQLPPTNGHTSFEDHLSDERGRGFGIMKSLADGLVVTIVPEHWLQLAIEKNHNGHNMNA